MNEPTLDKLVQRMDRLERENRWWRCGALLLVVLTAATVLILVLTGGTVPKGQGTLNPRIIEAEKFVLKDANGRVRGVLGDVFGFGEDASGAVKDYRGLGNYGLYLYGSDGRFLAGLGTIFAGRPYEETRLQLRGREREHFVSLTVGENTELEIHDKNTDSSAYLRVREGIASLDLSATEQTHEAAERENREWTKKFRAAKTLEEKLFISNEPIHGISARLFASIYGTSVLELVRGSYTRGGIKFSLLKEGQAALRLADEKGNERAVLGHIKLERPATGVTEEHPTSSLVLFNKDGKVIWKAP